MQKTVQVHKPSVSLESHEIFVHLLLPRDDHASDYNNQEGLRYSPHKILPNHPVAFSSP